MVEQFFFVNCLNLIRHSFESNEWRRDLCSGHERSWHPFLFVSAVDRLKPPCSPFDVVLASLEIIVSRQNKTKQNNARSTHSSDQENWS